MREILLENAYWFGPEWKALADEYESIPKKNTRVKAKFRDNKLTPALSKYLNINNSDTKDIVLKSIEKYGTNTKKNPCLIYIAGIIYGKRPFLEDKYANHLNYLLKLLYTRKIDQGDVEKKFVYSEKRQKFLYNIGLYNRSLDEFKWAIATIPEYTGKRYRSKDSEDVVKKTTPPFFDDKGVLKPHDELVKIIEEWEERKVDDEEEISNDELKITDKMITEYEKLVTTDDKMAFLKTYIFSMDAFKRLSGIRAILLEDFLISTIDPKKNVFLEFVLKLPFPVDNAQKYREKFRYIYESYKLKKLRLDLEVLTNPSLYDRSIRDFRYTLNAFNMCSNPSTVANYFKDTSKVDVKEFMNGDNVKPAGLNKKPGDTIYNKIEEWAQDNEYSAQEIEDRNDKLKNQGSKIKVSDLEDLKEKFKDQDLQTIEKALRDANKLDKDTLVYCKKKSPNENDDSNKGFYTWDGNDWQKYETPDARRVTNSTI